MSCPLTGLVLRSQAAVGWRLRLDRDDIMREVLTIAAGEAASGSDWGCTESPAPTGNPAEFAV